MQTQPDALEVARMRRELIEHMAATCPVEGVRRQHFVDAVESIPDQFVVLADDDEIGGFLILYIGQYVWFSAKMKDKRGWTTTQ